MRQLATFIAVVGAFILSSADTPAAASGPRNSGVSTVCGTFSINLDLLFTTISIDRPDEGWAWVDPTRKIRQVTGIARNPHVAPNDTPANHESHDVDFEIELDPGQEDLLSTQTDNAIGIEWESGIRPSEKHGDGASPTFPKWVWPSDGDRAWTEGNWIFDCGHPDNGLFHTEIHPPRAFASMRDQAAPLPGTGLTPVPVTQTDLYITGRGGYTPQQLNCGPGIVVGDYGDTCGQPTAPADQSYKTTPINDTDFTFDVCLPPRPPNAVFSNRADLGPRNTVGIEPQINLTAAAGSACSTDARFDPAWMMRVTVPLKNTATPPESIYARRIYAGWLKPPTTVLAHRKVTVDSTNLHEDHDLDPGDGEMTFWWVNLDRADGSWLRLSDFSNGDMDDYDDDTAFGDGEMNYTGAGFDFYLRDGQTFSIRSRGFEQDCFDNIGSFGFHQISLLLYAVCYADFPDAGAGDKIADVNTEFSAADLGPQTLQSDDDEYEMRVTIDEVPVGLEDTTFLSIGTSCAPAGEVALVGQPLTCVTRVDNAGPGLPRHVQVRNTVMGPAAVVNGGSWSIRAPFGNGVYPCSTAGAQATCAPDSVPVAAHAPVNVNTTATPSASGVFTEYAEVTTDSTDPDLSNNVASTSFEVFQSVRVDVAPGDASNVINLKRGGNLTVAILTTSEFDATLVNVASVCFGDAEAPAERTCTEKHGKGHLEDVNKDKRLDLVLHFEVSEKGRLNPRQR
jgi:hypothetical protein